MSSTQFVIGTQAYKLQEITDMSIGGATWRPADFNTLRKYLLNCLAKQKMRIVIYSSGSINGETFTGYLTASHHDKRTIKGEVQYYRGIEKPMQTAVVSISPTKGKMEVRFSNVSK